MLSWPRRVAILLRRSLVRTIITVWCPWRWFILFCYRLNECPSSELNNRRLPSRRSNPLHVRLWEQCRLQLRLFFLFTCETQYFGLGIRMIDKAVWIKLSYSFEVDCIFPANLICNRIELRSQNQAVSFPSPLAYCRKREAIITACPFTSNKKFSSLEGHFSSDPLNLTLNWFLLFPG